MTEEDPGLAEDLHGGAAVPPTGRVVGVDLGSVRVGVALCDADQRVATPLLVLARSREQAEDHGRLAEIIREHGAVGAVVGLPRSLSGRLGASAQGVLEEVAALRSRLSVPVETSDERLTTVLAREGAVVAMGSSRRGRGSGSSRLGARRGTGRAGRSRPVDATAAALILQTWLEARRAGRV